MTTVYLFYFAIKIAKFYSILFGLHANVCSRDSKRNSLTRLKISFFFFWVFGVHTSQTRTVKMYTQSHVCDAQTSPNVKL